MFKTKTSGNGLVISFNVALNHETVGPLRPRLLKAISTHDKVILNFENISFIDSSALGLLIAIQNKMASNGRSGLSIINATKDVANIIKATYVDRLIEINPEKKVS